MEGITSQKENSFVDWMMEHTESHELDIVLNQLLDFSPDMPEESRKGFERFVLKTGIAPHRNNRGVVFKIASCVFLLSSVVLGWFALDGQKGIKEWKEVYTAFGETNTVYLDDGTTVKLSSGSKLVYPECFGKDIRKVYLEGDAFLNVKKDGSRPFIVSAGSMDIHVLGTRFNVNSSTGQVEDEVALVEGAVEISFLNRNWKTMSLKSGEMLKVNKVSGFREIKPFVVNYYNSLSDNSGLFFYDSTLREIVETLSIKSGIPIVITDKKLLDKKFYAIFINGESVHDILNSLNFRQQFKILIEENRILIGS